MDFEGILYDLEIATEGINKDTGSDFRSTKKLVNSATKQAKAAMKQGRYSEAIKYCDDAIDALNGFKQRVAESGAETNGAVAGNAIVAAKSMVGAVLSTLAALSVAKVGSKVLAKRKATNEAWAAYEAWLVDEFGEWALENFEKAPKAMREQARKDKVGVEKKISKLGVDVSKLERQAKRIANNPDKRDEWEKLDADIKAKNGEIETLNAQKKEYEGIISGKIRVDANNQPVTQERVKAAAATTRREVVDGTNAESKTNRQKKAVADKENSKYVSADDIAKQIERRNKQKQKDAEAKSSEREQMRTATKNYIADSQKKEAEEREARRKEAAEREAKRKEESTKAASQTTTTVKPQQRTEPVAGDNTGDTVKNKTPEAPKAILSAKNIGIAAVGAGTVAALTSFIKNTRSGKNANVTSMIKTIDLSIKTLEGIKAQCQDAMRASESYEDFIDFDIEDENLPADEAFLVGAFDEVFDRESVLESLINLGFDDMEAIEFYVENFI